MVSPRGRRAVQREPVARRVVAVADGLVAGHADADQPIQMIVTVAGAAALISGAGVHPSGSVGIHDCPPIEQRLYRAAIHRVVGVGVGIVIGQAVLRQVADYVVAEDFLRAIGPEFLSLYPNLKRYSKQGCLH